MSVCRKLPGGTIQKIAGHTILLDANVSEIRQGTFNIQGVAGTDTSVQVTFSDPMPDTDYVVIYEYHSWGGYPVNTEPSPVTCINKTTTGFTARLWCFDSMSGPMIIKYTAFKLVKLDGYTELQNKVNNPDSTPTEDSLNLVTSGGVYDAIKDSGRIWRGTQTEWDAISSADKDFYDQAEISGVNNDGMVYVADKIESGNMNAVTSNAVANLGKVYSAILNPQNEFSSLSVGSRRTIMSLPVPAGVYLVTLCGRVGDTNCPDCNAAWPILDGIQWNAGYLVNDNIWKNMRYFNYNNTIVTTKTTAGNITLEEYFEGEVPAHYYSLRLYAIMLKAL